MNPVATATGILRHEHRLILRVVDAFERLLEDPAALPVEALSDCIVFFRLYTDACHHGKEEDLLFTMMEEQDLPGSAGPIAMLREEHAEGRALVRRLDGALDRARSGEEEAVRDVQRLGADYIDFIRAHIRKEDDGVFELADDMIRGAACSSLCAAYDTVCARRFDGRTLDELTALALRLTAG